MFKEYTLFKFSRCSSKKNCVSLVCKWRCKKQTPLSFMCFKDLNFLWLKTPTGNLCFSVWKSENQKMLYTMPPNLKERKYCILWKFTLRIKNVWMRNYAAQISLETQTSLKAGTANYAATSCSIIMKNLTSRQLSFLFVRATIFAMIPNAFLS